MSKFKEGDLVTTRLEVGHSDITRGKAYRLTHADEISVYFCDDAGYPRIRPARLYELVEAAPVVGESDPTGKSQHQPGAKLDAGKLRPSLVLGGFAHALKAVVKVGTDGANKYTDNGWREVPNGFARYSDAKCRHALAFDTGETHDKDTGSLHLAHEAWNALARLELYLQANPEERV